MSISRQLQKLNKLIPNTDIRCCILRSPDLKLVSTTSLDIIINTTQNLLGDLPTLSFYKNTPDPIEPGQINITETSAGVAEVQKVVVSSDARFVREVQRQAPA